MVTSVIRGRGIVDSCCDSGMSRGARELWCDIQLPNACFRNHRMGGLQRAAKSPAPPPTYRPIPCRVLLNKPFPHVLKQ